VGKLEEEELKEIIKKIILEEELRKLEGLKKLNDLGTMYPYRCIRI